MATSRPKSARRVYNELRPHARSETNPRYRRQSAIGMQPVIADYPSESASKPVQHPGRSDRTSRTSGDQFIGGDSETTNTLLVAKIADRPSLTSNNGAQKVSAGTAPTSLTHCLEAASYLENGRFYDTKRYDTLRTKFHPLFHLRKVQFTDD